MVEKYLFIAVLFSFFGVYLWRMSRGSFHGFSPIVKKTTKGNTKLGKLINVIEIVGLLAILLSLLADQTHYVSVLLPFLLTVMLVDNVLNGKLAFAARAAKDHSARLYVGFKADEIQKRLKYLAEKHELKTQVILPHDLHIMDGEQSLLFGEGRKGISKIKSDAKEGNSKFEAIVEELDSILESDPEIRHPKERSAFIGYLFGTLSIACFASATVALFRLILPLLFN